MGKIVHKAIVVTAGDKAGARRAHEEAELIGLQVLGPAVSEVNADYTLLICPSGSKTGWDVDVRHMERIERFKAWLRSESDGSSYFEWAEVHYSGDWFGARVVDHEWKEPGGEQADGKEAK